MGFIGDWISGGLRWCIDCVWFGFRWLMKCNKVCGRNGRGGFDFWWCLRRIFKWVIDKGGLWSWNYLYVMENRLIDV